MTIDELTIHIRPALDQDEEGYMYDIYDTNPGEADDGLIDSIDGGMCTGSLKDAIGMAMEQALDLVKDSNEALVCTEEGCKELQGEEQEFCVKHYK